MEKKMKYARTTFSDGSAFVIYQVNTPKRALEDVVIKIEDDGSIFVTGTKYTWPYLSSYIGSEWDIIRDPEEYDGVEWKKVRYGWFFNRKTGYLPVKSGYYKRKNSKEKYTARYREWEIYED